ncbi:MAG TPA: TolC family protein [Candidatus Omnitrophota bacterium]|nr:TolC family protein [Candidatus Omnitrophota bacterium]
MKRTLAFIFAFGTAVGLCLPASPLYGAETRASVPGIASVSEDQSISNIQPGIQPVSMTSAVPAEEPIAVRKDAPEARIEIRDETMMQELNKQAKEVEKAKTKALDDAVRLQVEALREERAREMPYLDRIYIRTSITPLKVQQKDEFLNSGPKNLKDLIVRAKSVHTQAKAAHENISLYNRRVLLAFRKLFPEASINFNNRKGQLSGSPFTGDDWHITLRQPIFNGGILWNTFLQEKASLEAAKKQFDKTLSELVFDLSRAYFEYQRALQTADEHQVLVDKMKRFAEMSDEKFKENLISEIEHLNVQSLYSQMNFDLESANQELEIARLEMQRYLDLSVNDQVQLSKIYNLDDVVENQASSVTGAAGASKTPPDVFKGEEKSPELSKLVDLSYKNRPELQVEAAKLQAQRLGERIRWGEFLPKAYLTYQFGALGEAYYGSGVDSIYASATPGSVTSYTDEPRLKKEWQLMLELNWNVAGNKVSYTFSRDKKAPSITQYLYGDGTQLRKNALNVGILDGLDAFVNVKQAEVDKLNQVVELEKAEKQVLQDVKQAYYDYQKATIQVNSTVKRFEYRKRLRDFAEYRLSKKEVELSEYLQAESDLTREKAELHKALKDYFSAKASLNHAVGIQDFLNLGTPKEPQSQA